jgi:hypothetical protein
MHLTMNDVFADEATLLAAGTLRSESTLYDTTGDADGYQVTPAAGSACTESSSGGGSAATPATPPTPPAATMPTSSFGWHGGVTAWKYGSLNTANEIVVIGGAWGKSRLDRHP